MIPRLPMNMPLCGIETISPNRVTRFRNGIGTGQVFNETAQKLWGIAKLGEHHRRGRRALNLPARSLSRHPSAGHPHQKLIRVKRGWILIEANAAAHAGCAAMLLIL